MDPLPPNFLPVGCASQDVKALTFAQEARVLPPVDDLQSLEAALKAYPVTVAVLGPAWITKDRAAAIDLVYRYAASCAVPKESSPEVMNAAIALALSEREERAQSVFFNRLLALLPDPVFYKDRCGRFLAANQAIARHFGVTDASVLIGRSDFDFFSAEHAQQAFDDEQEIIATGRSMEAKLERETYEDGSETWCLTWKAPLLDQAGRLIGIYGYSRDVTELKSTEAALATERHLLEALLTGLPDAIFIKDLQGRFLLSNQVLASWKGTTPAGLRGRKNVEFDSEELTQMYDQDDHAVITTGMPIINREEKVRTKDGKELWVLTSKLPYRNAEGKIIGLIGIARNISLRKAFDQELYSAQAEIASLRAEVERLRAYPDNR